MEKPYRLRDKEIKERFTLISLTPSSASEGAIKKYLQKNTEVIKNPKNNFHSTIRYQVETPFFPREEILREISSYFPIKISKECLSLKVFGDKELVLHHPNKKLKSLEKYLISKSFEQSHFLFDSLKEKEKEIFKEYISQRRELVYPSFEPHTTIADDFSEEYLVFLSEFQKDLDFDGFRWKY